jgi:hypothetical protein
VFKKFTHIERQRDGGRFTQIEGGEALEETPGVLWTADSGTGLNHCRRLPIINNQLSNYVRGAKSFLRIQSRNSLRFMQPEAAVPQAQKPATYPYHEIDQSIARPAILSVPRCKHFSSRL